LSDFPDMDEHTQTSGSDVESPFTALLHIDMDCFYASVEKRDNPALQNKKVIVARKKLPSVVTAADYEVRKTGVRAGMATNIARQLCPDCVQVEPDMDKYEAESERLMEIIGRVGGDNAVVEKVSVDEAYADVSRACQGATADATLENAMPLAKKIKQLVATEMRLTASVGIASERFLAKLASDSCKPDSPNPTGLLLVLDSNKIEFLKPLKVEKLYGVGEKTQAKLNKEKIFTVADLIAYAGDLRAIFGQALGEKLRLYALGKDKKSVAPKPPQKSHGKFASFIKTKKPFGEDVMPHLVLLSKQVEADLIKANVVGKTIEVAVCFEYKETGNDIQGQETLTAPTDNPGIIFAVARMIMAKKNMLVRPLRKLFVGVSNLSPAGATNAPVVKKTAAKASKRKKDSGQTTLSLFDGN